MGGTDSLKIRREQCPIELSTNPNEGMLPLEMAEVEAAGGSWDGASFQRARRDSTALVVDDDATVVRVVADMLTLQGFRTVVCHSAEEALRTLSTMEPPALVVVDQYLPGITGVDLAERFAALAPTSAVLLTSGYPGSLANSARAFAESAPATNRAVLYKPFSFEQLKRKLDELRFVSNDEARAETPSALPESGIHPVGEAPARSDATDSTRAGSR
jgi:DNA-binding NtrC family response regulator